MTNQKPTLKNILFVILLYTIIPLQSQIKFDFEGQNLSQWSMNNPRAWGISNTEPLSGSYSLKHILDTTISNHDQISYPLFIADAKNWNISWSFIVRHAYNPSSTNCWGVYLMSNCKADSMYPATKMNGYAIGVNLSGSDDSLRLWKIKSGVVSKLLGTALDWQEDITTTGKAAIKVKRSNAGIWEIFANKTGNTDSLLLQGTIYESELTNAAHFGIYYKYTSTQDRKLWIDDIAIDTAYVKLIEIVPADPPVDTAQASRFDVLMTEIMVDPEPVINLPAGEYVEIYNRSNKTFNLKDWTITIGSTTKVFPSATLAPQQFCIIYQSELVSAYSNFGRAIGLLTSSTTLTNTGQTIILNDSKNRNIHTLAYSDSWYANTYKAQGGWSLEMVDTNNPCEESGNWKVSVSKTGGTPGLINSVSASNTDTKSIKVSETAVLGDSILNITFSEYFDSLSMMDKTNFSINNNIGNPHYISFSDNRKSITLYFKKKLIANQSYQLTIKDKISDCVGNRLEREYLKAFSLPVSPDTNDIVINEVLFNAFAYGSDFVELYNRSNKTIDVGELYIAHIDESGEIINVLSMGTQGILLAPKAYRVVVEDIELLKRFYKVPNEETIFSNRDMISLPDDKGSLLLMHKDMTVLDRMNYSEDMHFAIISNQEGVSLERVNPDISALNKQNWHSASSGSGWATPGYKNSQYLSKDSLLFSNKFKLLNDVLSPDNDGVDDMLSIAYQMPQPGYIANINIFDVQGRLIRKLENTTLLATSGLIIWDGTNGNNQMVKNGIYIVHFEIFNLKGNAERFKKVCVVARR